MCAQHPMTKPVKNGPEDDYLLVETCILHITLCNNKYSRADVQFFSITIRILAIRDAFIQNLFGCCMYRLELLMMDGKTIRNM